MHVKVSSLVVNLFFLLLVFFSFFRFNVGTDYNAYLNMFDNPLLVAMIEPGSIVLKMFLDYLDFVNPKYFIGMASFITLFFIFDSIKRYSISPITSVVFFFLLGFYFSSLNGIRQYIAIALFVFSWRFIVQRKFIKYILVMLLATLFHSSAIIFILCYFLVKPIKREYLNICLFVSFLLSFFSSILLMPLILKVPMYSDYAGSQFVEMQSLLTIFHVIFPLYIYIKAIGFYTKIQQNIFATFLFNMSFFVLILTVIFPGVLVIARVCEYCRLAYIFLIPLLCSYMAHQKRVYFLSLVIFYNIVVLFILTYIRGNSSIFPFMLNYELLNGRLLYLFCVVYGIIKLFIFSFNGIKTHSKFL